MIIGIGVDNVEISRIKQAMKSQRFVTKVLVEREKAKFEDFSSESRQAEFLAGRWAAKEAFAKACGKGINSDLHFLDLEIKNDEFGNPEFIKPAFDGTVHLSISHTDLEAIAFVVLEKQSLFNL